jgi:hypothetical protein
MTTHFPCHTSPSRTPSADQRECTDDASLLALPPRKETTTTAPAASFKVNRRDGHRDDGDDDRRLPRLRERDRDGKGPSTGTQIATRSRLGMHDDCTSAIVFIRWDTRNSNEASGAAAAAAPSRLWRAAGRAGLRASTLVNPVRPRAAAPATEHCRAPPTLAGATASPVFKWIPRRPVNPFRDYLFSRILRGLCA